MYEKLLERPRFREYRRRSREILNVSTPIIIEQLLTTLLGMINVMMVSGLGNYAVSAVGMIDTITNIVIAIFTALTTGGIIVISQCMGKRDKQMATEVAAQSLVLSTGLSLIVFLFFLFGAKSIVHVLYNGAEKNVLDSASIYLRIISFSYPTIAITQTIFGVLRGSGDTKTPMYITTAMNIVSLVLGIILILGVDMPFFGKHIYIKSLGVAGAAIALLIARISGLVMSIYFITFRYHLIKLNKLSYFKPNFEIQKKVLHIGVPTSVESTIFNAGKLITQIFIVRMGTEAVAANTVGNSIINLIYVPLNAFVMGVMILIGNRVGKEEFDDIIPTANFCKNFGRIMIVIISVVLFIITPFFMKAYQMEGLTATYLKQLIFSCYIIIPFIWPESFIVPASLRATGDVKYTMVVATISMLFFRIISAYIIGIHLNVGILGVWIGMYIDWFIRAILFRRRLNKGYWKSNIS